MTPPDIKRPDVAHILAGLKDFQRDTVDYVYRRMYADADRTHRFLLADEVGLGKTLIARGLVAKAVEHLWDEVKRIDVVYICSSGDIARQNVNKLNITGRREWALASRVTMLPTQLKDIQKRKVNFIAFTPGTTFSLSSSSGKSEERVLLYSLLKSAWGIRGTGPKNLLQGWVSNHERFRGAIRDFEHGDVDPFLRDKFHEAIEARLTRDAGSGRPTIKERFDELSDRFGRARKHVPREDRRDQSRLIGELRSLLASTCIRALEPDLVILDEFQRFKDLLTVGDDGEDEAEEVQLARELFDYKEEQAAEKTRILLLSATPYKMYTAAGEAGGEDHYADFRQTLRFLHDNPNRSAHIEELLERYRRDMMQIAERREDLLSVRQAIEGELRRVMVRTERLAASADRNGMLRQVDCDIALTADEALSYRDLHKVARAIDHPETIEYWKAAPYPLSFMDDYELKKGVTEHLENPALDPAATEAIRSARSLFLSKEAVETRQPLLPPHARMRWLLDLCVGEDLWKLLWIPATAPYYQPRGQFQAFKPGSVTKRLIFSAWQVVPKAIAALVTYEAERRMFAGVARAGETLSATRERLTPLLRFNRNDGRLTGLPVMGMIYPSFRLAELGDSLIVSREGGGGAEGLLREVEGAVAAELEPIVKLRATKGGAEDESWYWAAPLLLDVSADRGRAVEWINRLDAASLWAGAEQRRRGPIPRQKDAEEEADSSAWADHVAEMRDVLALREFGRPPADLARVLAEMAVGAPAACALRALCRGTAASMLRDPEVRDAAGQIAFAYRNLFNLPEARAILGGAIEPYWRAVLGYAIDGNLQALLDEYVHVLRDAQGLFGQSAAAAASEIAREVRNALSLRTARVGVDELTTKGALAKHNLRASFAVRFGDEADVDGSKANRKDLVRAAFNSPFWPFVLASTSVGQEGLDFHLYCHSVIHWNLPSNPVDLEQREGRVHRFKGHAVRKNVAARHVEADANSPDVWDALFDRARVARSDSASDIVPYWVYAVEGGAAIERHVPALPLSRDEVRLRQLKRSLALYRMVFGQPRQDELLDFLLSQMTPEEATARLDEVRIDLSPRHPTAKSL